MKKKKTARVRRWRPEDIWAILACHRAAYPDFSQNGRHYDERAYQMQLAAFPEGQFLTEIEEQVVGYTTSLTVQLDDTAFTPKRP